MTWSTQFNIIFFYKSYKTKQHWCETLVLGIDATWDNCGRLQLTGTRMVLELDPEEVEEVLRVTAMALAFPSLPPDPWSSSKRRPITGVWEDNKQKDMQIFWGNPFLFMT